MAQTNTPLAAAIPSLSGRRPQQLQGVVFDMDGTLTMQGAIDFAAMRRRCGVPPGVDIITHCEAAATQEERERLLAIVHEEEEAGLQRMALRPHVASVIAALAARGLRRGILTRNNEFTMAATLKLMGAPSSPHPSYFDPLLSRSFTPVKPHPEPLHHIARAWDAPHGAASLVMVGDSVDDMACGRAAGAVTVLIGDDAQCPTFLKALPHADHAIACLSELITLVDAWLADTCADPAGAADAAGGGSRL